MSKVEREKKLKAAHTKKYNLATPRILSALEMLLHDYINKGSKKK